MVWALVLASFFIQFPTILDDPLRNGVAPYIVSSRPIAKNLLPKRISQEEIRTK